MKRSLVIFAALALLALPVIVGAEETRIPPETNWTPTPPAQRTVDPAQLVELLREKGVITTQDYAQLTRPQLSAPSREGHARVWTWDKIDHNPVLRAGRSGGN
ncbi:MAG: hypothetical protein ACRERE_12305 [Candidatus Entotheonellia bacterium]